MQKFIRNYDWAASLCCGAISRS